MALVGVELETLVFEPNAHTKCGSNFGVPCKASPR